MSLLYKDPKDLIFSVDFKRLPDGKVNMIFSCDGGKHGTDEMLDEYKLTVEDLLSILQKHEECEIDKLTDH